MKGKNRAIVYLSSYIAMVLVNIAANFIPIGGSTVGENATNYDVLFMPAGYAFMIWGFIYLLLGIFVIWQILPENRDNKYVDRLGWAFPISCACNVLWLIVWQFNLLILSMIAMTCLLISLFKIYTSLEIGNRTILRKYKYIVNLPFMVYLGWASTTLTVNSTVFLYATRWYGFGFNDWFWACFLVVATVALALYIIKKYDDIIFPIIQIWALIAVMIYSYYCLELVLFCIAGSAVLAVSLIVRGVKEIRIVYKIRKLTEL